jgi:hypothetical protein
MKRSGLSLSFAIAACVLTAQAHHSITGVYDTNRQVKLEGTITEFHFVNPHPYVTLRVLDGGSTQQWRLEMDNRSELTDVGMTKDSLKAGDKILVSGYPAAPQGQGLYIRRLDRPADGFTYEQIGNSPRINFKPR